MKDMTQYTDVMSSLNDLERKINDSILIIDGNTLSVVLSRPAVEERFFEVAKNAPSVCICRCSPTQKAIVAKKI